MSGRNKEFTTQVKLAALDIVEQSGVLEQNITILPLAKKLMAQTNCGIDTAKSRIAWAARRWRHFLATGEPLAERQPGWGGHREGAGRPSKEESQNSPRLDGENKQ